MDESTVPVIDNEKHKTRKGYEWCVLDGLSSNVMFYYDRGSRAANVAREVLGGYKGNVQADGYAAYDQFEEKSGMTMHGCWTHLRRKFVEALDTDKRHATEAIVYISKRYKVESEADEAKLTAEQRKEKRVKESYPVMVILVFEKWMKDTYPTVLPKGAGSVRQSNTPSLFSRDSPVMSMTEGYQSTTILLSEPFARWLWE